LTPDGGSAKNSIVSARAPGYRPLEDEGSALGRLIGLQWSRPGGERMRFFSFEIVIEREAEDDGYSAYSPTLPGCFSNGKTIEEAKRHIREAIQQHVEALLARGQPVPQNERLVHVEELTVGIP
jgi:predicted RNase H-like HicB family nuclease